MTLTHQQTIAAIVRDSHAYFVRYLKGFDEANALRQTPELPNHVVWTLGHLAITFYRAAAKLDGLAPASSAFVEGRAGDALRFGMEGVAYGSRPSNDASLYPPLDRAKEIFADAIERFASAVEACDDAALEREVAWGTTMIPTWRFAARMVFHNGTHCGQVADLRRAIGMGSIFA